VKRLVTSGIILRRTNYGEADRILTVLTPDHGKLRLIAKGSRRLKSKLAGGIDLFTVSDLIFIQGKSEIGTLVSSRMQRYYSEIVKNLERTQLGYELIKQLDKATEDQTEAEYFTLLQNSLAALDDADISLDLIRIWFEAQLLRLAGHTPNLTTDNSGEKLQADGRYKFDFEDITFTPEPKGHFNADYIKLLRLLFSTNQPPAIARVQGVTELLPDCQLLLRTMLTSHIRI